MTQRDYTWGCVKPFTVTGIHECLTLGNLKAPDRVLQNSLANPKQK